MKENLLYAPFQTTQQLGVQPSLLSAACKEAMLLQAKEWPNGYKLKQGSIFSYQVDEKTCSVVLQDSIIKIDNDVYVMHKPQIAKGGQGRIKVLESLSKKTFSLVKISYIPENPVKMQARDLDMLDDVMNEVDTLTDRGMCRGKAQRIRPSQAGLCKHQAQNLRKRAEPKDLNRYLTKHYTVMPYLGQDLKKQLQRLDEKQITIPDEACFVVEIEALWELTKWHLGLAFISGEPRMHRDIKPANMVVNRQGVQFIDCGFSEKDPSTQVTASIGTPPYVIIDRDEYFPTLRTGAFFDMDAMRRTSYGPLCNIPKRLDEHDRPMKDRLGILTEQVVHNYHLGRYLEQAYNEGGPYDYPGYKEEEQLEVTDPMTFTAIMIASQMRLTDDELLQILADEDLAAVVVGTYFSNQVDWLVHGQEKLRAVLTQSNDERRKPAGFVRLGLSHKLEAGLKDKALCGILNSDKSREIKRAAICLFQRDLWDIEVCRRLSKYPDFAERCLRAHFNEEEDRLKLLELIYREKMPPSSFVPEHVDLVSDILHRFPLTADNIKTLHQFRHVLGWFYDYANTHLERGFNSQARHDLNIAARLYTFLVDVDYQKALLTAYDWFCDGWQDDAEKILALLLSNASVDTAKVIAAFAPGLSRTQLLACSSRAEIRMIQAVLKRHPQLVLEDLVFIYQKDADAFLLMTALSSLKMELSTETLGRLVNIHIKNRTLFLELINEYGRFNVLTACPGLFDAQTTERLVKHMLSTDELTSYIFEAGDEHYKLQALLTVLSHHSFTYPFADKLSDAYFLKAIVMMIKTHCFTLENLKLIRRNELLARSIADETIISEALDDNAVYIKLVCANFGLNIQGLDLKYPSLPYLILELHNQFDYLKQAKKTMSAFIELYRQFDVIHTAFQGQQDFTNGVFDKMKACMGKKGNDYLQALEALLVEITDFSSSRDCLNAAERIVLEEKSFFLTHFFSSCSQQKANLLSSHVEAIHQQVTTVREAFGVLKGGQHLSMFTIGSPENSAHLSARENNTSTESKTRLVPTPSVSPSTGFFSSLSRAYYGSDKNQAKVYVLG